MECIAAHRAIVTDVIEAIMIQREVRIIVPQAFQQLAITVIDSRMHHGIRHGSITDSQSLQGNMREIHAVRVIRIQATSGPSPA